MLPSTPPVRCNAILDQCVVQPHASCRKVCIAKTWQVEGTGTHRSIYCYTSHTIGGKKAYIQQDSNQSYSSIQLLACFGSAFSSFEVGTCDTTTKESGKWASPIAIQKLLFLLLLLMVAVLTQKNKPAQAKEEALDIYISLSLPLSLFPK